MKIVVALRGMTANLVGLQYCNDQRSMMFQLNRLQRFKLIVQMVQKTPTDDVELLLMSVEVAAISVGV